MNAIARGARAAALWLIAALLHAGALAHDAGVQNGVFRSRDGGATWLQVDAQSFVRGALALAVHPRDPHHLLLATDSGLMRSRNGGRDWQVEAPHVFAGPVFAVAFSADGVEALASSADALHRFDGTRWRVARTPAGAAPARALVPGGTAGRVYLLGWNGLHRSDDFGRRWTRVNHGFGAAAVSTLAVAPHAPDRLFALAAGRVWSSTDGARRWHADEGAPRQTSALAFDRTLPTRLWLVAERRAYRQDDLATLWQPIGTPIPDAQAAPRAIDAAGDALLVATDRGVFRSADAGANWTLLSAELPEHSETTLLRDPHDALTIYASFTRMTADQLARASSASDNGVARGDIAWLVGAYGAFALLLLGLGVIVRRITRAGVATRAQPALDDMRAEPR